MDCSNGSKSARRAAALAQSRIAASVRQQAVVDESDDEVEQPPRKIAHNPVATKQRVHPNGSDLTPEWYIAVDFGTTFTTVAWYRRGMSTQQIQTIDNFPGTTNLHLSNRQIPTEIWFPTKSAPLPGQVSSSDVRVRFGSEVHRMANADDGLELRKFYDDADRVTMMKLLLDKTKYAQASKERLQQTLNLIKVKNHIEKDEDVYFHFFRGILAATKTRLGNDFRDDSIGKLISLHKDNS